MKSSERILKAALELAGHQAYDKITFADVAKEAGVHWTTVQRYFGCKEDMRKILLERQTQNNHQSLSDTRTKILDAANRVFAKYGYESATLDQVASDAGMTKGAVYWHFSSKSDLFLAICDRSLRQLTGGLAKQCHDVFTSPDPMEAIRILLESELGTCEEGAGEKPTLFFEFISGIREPAVRKKLCESFSNLFNETTDIFKAIQSKDLVTSRVDPHSLSVALHALVNGIVLMWLIAPEQVSFKSISAEVSKILWNGLQPNKL
ncbi:MAG: TetR family transcriptional regulator [Eubacterium sp.]|jgi:AcrR family transcriptional regulator|nr:TetR family transcriptional regulator [Eubacterium sp.]